MTMTESDVVYAEQQLDKRPRAVELGDHVEHADRYGRERGRRTHARLVEPARQHVCERVLAQVSQRLGHQQQHHQVSHQETYREVEAREAGERDGTRDPQERRRREVVARDGEAVLPTLDRAARHVVVAGGLVLARRPDGDAERQRDDQYEEDDGYYPVAHSDPPVPPALPPSSTSAASCLARSTRSSHPLALLT